MLASILLVAGNVAIQFVADLEWLDIQVYQFYILYLVRFVVLFIVFFLAISFIYYFGPAVLIALMIWQEILSIVMLVGYEINASIHQAYRVAGIGENNTTIPNKES